VDIAVMVEDKNVIISV